MESQDMLPGVDARVTAEPGTVEPRDVTGADENTPSTRRSQYVVLALATWTTLGLFLDVWSHGQVENENFFSLQHALFIPGFLAAAGYILWPVVRAIRAGHPGFTGVSSPHALAAVGAVLFAVGLIGDALWHAVFGVERGIEAVMSPPHIFMLMGLVLISSLPFRLAWVADDPGASASFRVFLPVLLSLALAMLIICLGAIYFWGFASSRFFNELGLERLARDLAVGEQGLPAVREAAQQLGIGNLLLTTTLLLTPVLLLLRRWQPPFGSVTFLFGTLAILMAAVSGTFYVPLVLAPIGGGLAADMMIRAWQPSPQRVGALRTLAAGVPLVTWGLFLAATAALWGVAWTPGMWLGAIMWTAAGGVGLSILVAPGGTSAASRPGDTARGRT